MEKWSFWPCLPREDQTHISILQGDPTGVYYPPLPFIKSKLKRRSDRIFFFMLQPIGGIHFPEKTLCNPIKALHSSSTPAQITTNCTWKCHTAAARTLKALLLAKHKPFQVSYRTAYLHRLEESPLR